MYYECVPAGGPEPEAPGIGRSQPVGLQRPGAEGGAGRPQGLRGIWLCAITASTLRSSSFFSAVSRKRTRSETQLTAL
jgi:hypothetical protein